MRCAARDCRSWCGTTPDSTRRGSCARSTHALQFSRDSQMSVQNNTPLDLACEIALLGATQVCAWPLSLPSSWCI
eukprot:312496-Pleurochrysis_carterae.AAC.1